jgi:hypothetical protein
MSGGSEWLFSATATPNGTMGQQAKKRHMRAVVITEPGEPEVMQWLRRARGKDVAAADLTPWSEAVGRGDRLGG